MTTTYSTKTTILDNFIIIESLIGSQTITNIVTRGPNEDMDLKAIAISHKQQADVILTTDQPQALSTRLSIDK
jgi:predicted nucleic acid-binding protein